MPMERNSSAQEAVSGPGVGVRPPRSRRLLRVGSILIIVVALLGLLFFYAPRYVVRYLFSSKLDDLGIDYEGVETLGINPWTGELWLGTVRFGSGPSDRGRLGELGLTMRFNPLSQRRISMERLLLRGIDVVVTRGKDHALALNGILLEQFIPSRDVAGQPAGGGDAWGAVAKRLPECRSTFDAADQGSPRVAISL